MLDVICRMAQMIGLFINCLTSKQSPIIHTNFFAFKLEALLSDALGFLHPVANNAERAFPHDIKTAILDKVSARWIRGAQPKKNICLAGHERKAEDTQVLISTQKRKQRANWPVISPSFQSKAMLTFHLLSLQNYRP